MNLLNRLFRPNKIRVTFIDRSSGKIFGQSSMNLDQLPEDFSIETTMHLDAKDWIVEEATSFHISQFSQTKRLTLKLRKVEKIDLSNLLFTLPTISNEIPDTTTDQCKYRDFEILIREDDWRQNEFLNSKSKLLVDIEFKKIQDIWTYESKKVDEQFTAFKNCHVRSSIGEPQLSISLRKLKDLLGTSETGCLKINETFVVNGFSLRTKDTHFYGTLQDDVVTLLSVCKSNEQSVREIHSIVETFDVIFVSWHNTQVIE